MSAALAALLVAAPLQAQAPSPPDPATERGAVELATSLGAFAAFPEDFSEPFCVQDTWAAGGSAAVGLARGVALETGLTVANGLGGITCAVPAAPGPPPEPGATWVEEVVADGVRRNHFVSTSLTLSWMMPVGERHVRVQAGGARLWDKDANALVAGAVFPFRLAGHAFEAGFTWWRVRLPVERRRIVVSAEGEPVVVGRSRFYRHPGALLLRLGYRYRIR